MLWALLLTMQLLASVVGMGTNELGYVRTGMPRSVFFPSALLPFFPRLQ